MRLRIRANISPISDALLSGTTNVRIGLRPPGSSVSAEISRSPNQVMAAVRGIGVAVMTSRCGAVAPLEFNDSRCSTPKRCCSSITASVRFGAWKLLENAACVATTMQGMPDAAAASTRRRSASRMPPVRRNTGISPSFVPNISFPLLGIPDFGALEICDCSLRNVIESSLFELSTLEISAISSRSTSCTPLSTALLLIVCCVDSPVCWIADACIGTVFSRISEAVLSSASVDFVTILEMLA